MMASVSACSLARLTCFRMGVETAPHRPYRRVRGFHFSCPGQRTAVKGDLYPLLGISQRASFALPLLG